ncbi:DUF4917 family protein [Veillonella sp. oral taxon 158]|jgi:hypothetical protein|uniref:DUF4917 family protein n=1 Tax=Veillonella sp. oral taxon 158 TaxID=671228 RepID=UPI0001EB43B5|nr:DUF4917 family protein [Veillonella sp. oral taxon 158]EFR60322.1 hypothetical protein HMPREF9199_1976 [Veillonella sp. oral taxon 158 str. F0412]
MLEKYSELIAGMDFGEVALIVGNGASISLSNNFNYNNLFLKAEELGYLSPEIAKIFSQIGTSNFEAILNQLDITQKINNTLSLPDILISQLHIINNAISTSSNQIKTALIETIRSVHPNYTELSIVQNESNDILKLNKFLNQFDYIINLNYDLLIYYIILVNKTEFIDSFRNTSTGRQNLSFDEDVINTPYGNKTKLYYPHGNIVLCVDSNGEEQKIRCSEGNTLLQEILNTWEGANQLYPLFICEGTSNEKVKGIYRNYYLTYVYKKILPNLPSNIVCYGWSLSENDEHILKQILKDSQRSLKFLISIRTDEKTPLQVETECTNIKNRITNINSRTEVHFFDKSDEGCWLNYNY